MNTGSTGEKRLQFIRLVVYDLTANHLRIIMDYCV